MKEKGRPGSRAVRIVLFFAYLVILIYLLFFAESFGRGISDDYRYNFVPFTEIRRYLTYWETIGIFGVLLNLVGNVAAFMPFGYFLSALTDNRLKAISVLLFSCLLYTSRPRSRADWPPMTGRSRSTWDIIMEGNISSPWRR